MSDPKVGCSEEDMRNSRMKRNAFIILLLLLMGLSAGCSSRVDEMNSLEEKATYRANLMNTKIRECVNNNDHDALVNLFSESVQNDVTNLDDQAVDFIDEFDGKRIQEFAECDPLFEGADYAQPMEIYDVYDVILENGEECSMAVWIWAIDDEHPENVGLTQIQFLNCAQDKIPEGFQWEGREQDNRGILLLEYGEENE